jgi:hypothetical protein
MMRTQAAATPTWRHRHRRRWRRKTLVVAWPLPLVLLLMFSLACAVGAQPDTIGYRTGWTLSAYPNPSKVRSNYFSIRLNWFTVYVCGVTLISLGATLITPYHHAHAQREQPEEAQACGPYHAQAKGATSFLCDPDAILTRQGAIQYVLRIDIVCVGVGVGVYLVR